MSIVEYRGVSDLVYAPVTVDDGTAYTTGTVKSLAGVAEISKTTDASSEAHYYDNNPAVVINSTGADEITITTSAIPLDVLADITGQTWDSTNGVMIEGERTPQYFAIGYITKKTDGTEIYVWRYKGTFSFPDMTNATEDDGTDANGQELTFTGVATTHKFTATSAVAKGMYLDKSVNTTMAESTFFGTVYTPDSFSVSVADETEETTTP